MIKNIIFDIGNVILNFNIKEVLQKEFTPKYGLLEKNKKLYNQILETNSVCITIRRGDFVSDPHFKKNLYVCDEKYFETAINLIKKKINNPVRVIT